MNKQKNYQINLSESIKVLEDSIYWFNRSFTKCSKIGIKDNYNDDEFDVFETLCSRYSRTCDILINKVFRSLDYVELENPGSLIDIVNRAHKRNFFDNIDTIRLLKDLRNQIVHEYIKEDLIEIFSAVYKFSQILFEIIERVNQYIAAKKYLQ